MSSTDTLYTARLLYETVQKDRANVLKCRVYRAGALVAPTSGTVSVYAPDGTAVVSATSVTISGSIAQYSLSAGAVSAYDYGDGWRIEWALTMPDSTVHTFRNTGSLVYRQLYPVVTEADLYRRESALNPSNATVIHSATDFADKLDEAWADITDRLVSTGRLPWLAMEPSAFRRVHSYLALHLIFEDFASRLNEAYQAKAAHYWSQYQDAWSQLAWKEATTDGQTANKPRRSGGSATLWTCGR